MSIGAGVVQMIKEFVAKDGATYAIKIDEDGETITVVRGGAKLGTISLDWHEAEPSIGEPAHFKITHLELANCKGKGLGEACLRYHRECFDAPLVAGDADRGESSDGSHLIEYGVGFIARMREKQIVCRSAFDIDRPNDEDFEDEETQEW